ncbi:MAG TPA: MazG nucleotide pyrophosphohydrolase domain-containing protein [Candidatus Dojkabacteria bacterium]
MKKSQLDIKEFIEKYSLESNLESRILDLVSEVGEVAKEILKSSDYGKRKPESSDELELEIGDVVYSLAAVANYFEIDLEEAAYKALEKYMKRFENKGNIDSGK